MNTGRFNVWLLFKNYYRRPSHNRYVDLLRYENLGHKKCIGKASKQTRQIAKETKLLFSCVTKAKIKVNQ